MKKLISFLLISQLIVTQASTLSAAATLYNGWPSGTLPSDTTSVMLSFETDSAVQYCRYATTPNLPIDMMTDYFGGWGTSLHYQIFQNLTRGNTYHFYFKCADINWDVNDADYEISFSIAGSPSPAINQIEGVVSHGQSIIINGSSFGIKSPAAPLMYDLADEQTAYAGLHNGDPVPSGGINPWNNTNAYYKTTNPRGKNLVHYSNQWTTTPERRAIVGADNFPETANQKLYLSYWLYTDGDFNPILNSDGDRNQSNKFMRLTQDADWFQEDYNAAVIWSPHLTSYTVGSGWQITPAVLYSGPTFWQGWNELGNIGYWNRNEIIIDNATSASGPRVTESINEKLLLDFQMTVAGNPPPDITGIGSLGFDSSNPQGDGAPMVDWGEIYIDNTLARVLICNTETWGSAERNHCEIQIPQNIWNNSQIQLRVNQGSFANGANAYIYIIDASGNVNATGWPITFDSAGEVLPPASPSGLSVR